jgi:hypothetical protein
MTQRDAVELARRAYALMADSFAPCPPPLVPSFRVWHFPPAGPQTSWVLFHGRVDDPLSGTPLVRRVVWDRDADLERLETGTRRRPTLEPTLTITEREPDTGMLSRVMREATGLGVPQHRLVRPYVSHDRAEFGLEGFDVEGSDGRPIVRIEWDRNPPPDLEALAGWAAWVRQWLARLTS